ncbi:MAG: cupin domain-containing protein [Neofamilia sp.]
MDFNDLGRTIKETRLEKGLSIKNLAEGVGVSSSLLSQIERGLANPSLNTLRSIANELNVPMFSLFIYSEADYAQVVRKDERSRITVGHAGSDEIEPGYDILSPDLKSSIQLYEMDLMPGKFSSNLPISHKGEEISVCVEGDVELHIYDSIIELSEGDSVRIEKNTPHRWHNPGDENCKLIVANSPPML